MNCFKRFYFFLGISTSREKPESDLKNNRNMKEIRANRINPIFLTAVILLFINIIFTGYPKLYGNEASYINRPETEEEMLYSYSTLRSIFRPKTRKDEGNENTNTGNEKRDDTSSSHEDFYDRLQQKINSELEDVFQNPSHNTAITHMVWVEVPVWRLKEGKKVRDTEKIQVLNLLADEVKDIFTEIYRGKEKFPIHTLIGYTWRPNGLKSLHNTGRAIDINPNENPQIDTDGRVLVGKKWEPGTNPFSITPDGDVVRAFTKRGWRWGRDFRRPDYMHFGFREM